MKSLFFPLAGFQKGALTMRNAASALCISLSMAALTQCASPPPEFSEADWYEKTHSPDTDTSLLYAPHKNEKGIFFNPWMEREKRSGSWFWRKKQKFEEPSIEKYGAVQNDYSYLSDSAFDSITFAGHASMIIKLNGQTIFTDPFFSNAALIRPKAVKIKFDYSKVPEKPVVLISHNHYDHLDKKSVKNLIKKDPVFIVPLGLKKYIESFGAKTVHELDWWQSVKIGAVEYTLLPAQHWSRRIGQKGGVTLWGGYIIQGSKTIYFSGDSGYFIGFEEFGKKWNIDYAIMGAGAYEPRWFMHYAHMNIDEFIRAAEDLNAKVAIPMHFGVISLSDEPILYPLLEIDYRLSLAHPEARKKILPLRVGEYLRITGQ